MKEGWKGRRGAEGMASERMERTLVREWQAGPRSQTAFHFTVRCSGGDFLVGRSWLCKKRPKVRSLFAFLALHLHGLRRMKDCEWRNAQNGVEWVHSMQRRSQMRPTKPTTKGHPLGLRFSVPVAHSLVLTGVLVLEQAVVVSSGDK